MTTPYIIAEIGINHNGCVQTAKKLIDVAVETGCNAVKFQKRNLESIYTRDVLENLKNYEQGLQYLIPILKDFELSRESFKELKAYSDSKNIDFLSTAFDPESAHFINSLNVKAFKVSSADLTNFILLETLVQLKKPLYLSVGMSSLEEIDRTVSFLKKHNTMFTLLHCVSSYPVLAEHADMGKVQLLKERYDCPIGYSGHDSTTYLSVAAVSLGATVIEKHITLDKKMRGPDHKLSLLPDELKKLCTETRSTYLAINNKNEELQQGEVLNRLVFRKSLYYSKDLPKGHSLEIGDFAAKSPHNGICVQNVYDFVGKTIVKDVQEDQLTSLADFDESISSSEISNLNWGKQGLVVRYHDFEHALFENLDCLEFHLTYGDTQLEIPHEKFKKYQNQLKKFTLRVHSCEYIGEDLFNICATDQSSREKAKKMLQKVIDITSELSQYFKEETPLIVFNCGGMTLYGLPDDSTEIDFDSMVELINSLDRKNTNLMAQNMPPFPWYYGGQWKGHCFLRSEELIDFCQKTNSFICLDLSHAQMACNYLGVSLASFMQKVLPYVKHLHISDASGVEGEGVQIGAGDINFKEFFEIFSNYTETWIPEIWQGHTNYNAGAKKALEILKAVKGP